MLVLSINEYNPGKIDRVLVVAVVVVVSVDLVDVDRVVLVSFQALSIDDSTSTGWGSTSLIDHRST